jgi:hypothetical protein
MAELMSKVILIYCTISNNSAKGGDRGQRGRNLDTGHVAGGQGT